MLKTHSVHLLLTPAAIGCVSAMRLRRGVATSATSMIAAAAPAPLWKAASKACAVQSDEHLQRCCRYIEPNPVRAGMVNQASGYPWSSYAANARGATDPLVSPHPQYLALHAEDTARQRLYRDGDPSAMAPEAVGIVRPRLQRPRRTRPHTRLARARSDEGRRHRQRREGSARSEPPQLHPVALHRRLHQAYQERRP